MNVLEELVVMVLSVFGLAYILGHARITLAARTVLAETPAGHWLVLLLECPACLSFWLGLGYGALAGESWHHCVQSALVCTTSSWCLATWTGLHATERDIPDDEQPKEE